MLKSVLIRGFQSHTNSRLDLSPGVNAIVGPSDGGKSAIARAITWAVTNTPIGDSFINWSNGPKDITEVALEFTDGQTITRQRSKTINQYLSSTFDDPLKALRTGVPPEIIEVLQMIDTNIQKQHTWFLLDKSPGEIARGFNALYGIDVIDRALKITTSKMNKASDAFEVAKRQLSGEQEVIATLEELIPEMQSRYEALELLTKQVTDADRKMAALVTMVTDYQASLKQVEAFKPVAKAIALVLEIKSCQDELNKVESEIRKLTDMVTGISKSEEAIEKLASVQDALELARELVALSQQITGIEVEIFGLRKVMSQYEQAIAEMSGYKDVGAAIGSMREIMRLTTTKDELEKDIYKLLESLSNLKKEKQNVSDADKIVKDLHDSVDNEIKDLKHCPLCGHQLKER